MCLLKAFLDLHPSSQDSSTRIKKVDSDIKKSKTMTKQVVIHD